MLSIAPRTATLPPPVSSLPVGQRGPLRNAYGVANEVLWPCGRAVWSATMLAPVRAIALLGWALGLRHAKRRPMARKISGCATSHAKPMVRHQNPLQVIGQQLNHAATDFAGAVSGWLHSLAELAPKRPSGGINQIVALDPDANETSSEALVRPGTLFQNDYMTLWNDSNDPVSAVLHVVSGDLFELTVDHLDSVNGGSCGQIIFRSGYTMTDIPNQPHRKRLQLKICKDVKPLEYDDQLFERPARMALGLLKRASWMLAGAFEMEYDCEKNTVTAGPKAAVLKPFWEKVVELKPTPKESLWTWEPMQRVPMEHAFAAPSLVTA